MTGFIAGMPFLGDLDDSLYARRLDTPRVKVPKNSIGLTEQFCNIFYFNYLIFLKDFPIVSTNFCFRIY